MTPSARHIGIILPNWIGDVVMATPALRAIRRHFGAETELTGIIKPYAQAVLAGNPWFDQLLLYDHRSEHPEYRTGAVARHLRTQCLDAMVVLPNSHSSAWLAWRSGASHRLGYDRGLRRILLTDSVSVSRRQRRQPTSAVDYYLNLVDRLGCTTSDRRMELATTAEEEHRADQAWDALDLHRHSDVVVLSTGGAYGAAKRWPDAHFAKLARKIVHHHDVAVLVVCGPAERDAARNIVKQAAHPRVTSLAEQPLSIGLSKAAIRRSRLAIATDSGPRHLAAAFGVPLISLFGPTDPGWAITYHPDEIMLQHEVACQPCGKRTCPLKHHACMNDLTPERVFQAVAAKLGTSPARRAA